MGKDEIKLMDTELSKEQLISLFNLSLNVTGLARHDLRNNRTGLSMLLGNSMRAFEAMSREEPGTDRFKDFTPVAVETLKEAIEKLTHVLDLLEGYFEFYSDSTFDEHFIAKPRQVVEGVRRFHQKSDIAISDDSPKSLAILYPVNTLFGIFREIIENAEKHNKSDSKILIRWGVEGENFQCEIHDNGTGIAPAIGQSFCPLDVLTHRADVNLDGISGLKHVFRIVASSQGLLLFSNSRILGGTLVYFKLPILGHTLQ
jgi:K+-sensing histidine kinase KdpD